MGQATDLKDAFESGVLYFILPIVCAMILGVLLCPFRKKRDDYQLNINRSSRQRIIELSAILLTIVFINRLLPRQSNNKILLYSIVVAYVALREWHIRIGSRHIVIQKAISMMLALIELVTVMFAIAWILLYSIHPFID